MSTSELKRCPFCGGEAELKLDNPPFVYVQCEVCYAKTRARKVRDIDQIDLDIIRVKKDWNRRTCDEDRE